ncbi:signal peptidase II [Spiribacter insolitus]|uniref:Lipoprotein signal peptidase n=1 Tax=Spiribacter insolitus TaxID=3122417 RepID=A0ABV3T5G4_9GAMM
MPVRPVARSGLPLGVATAVVVLVADQLTKWMALSALEPYQPVSLLPVLNLTLAFNAGAAFSFLADGGGWQRWLLSGVAVAVGVYLLIWLRGLDAGKRLEVIGLGLILGGAVGNLVDRLRLGGVIDFIDVHVGGWHWPAFNVADSAITLGVVAVLVTAWRDWRRGR